MSTNNIGFIGKYGKLSFNCHEITTISVSLRNPRWQEIEWSVLLTILLGLFNLIHNIYLCSQCLGTYDHIHWSSISSLQGNYSHTSLHMYRSHHKQQGDTDLLLSLALRKYLCIYVKYYCPQVIIGNFRQILILAKPDRAVNSMLHL